MLEFYSSIFQETEIKVLRQEFNALKESIENKTIPPNPSPEVAKLHTENVKLKHRLAILNRAISKFAADTNKTNAMENIQDVLYTVFSQAISAAYPDVTDAPVVITLSGNNPKFGDYQCNSAMPIANILKQLGKEILRIY